MGTTIRVTEIFHPGRVQSQASECHDARTEMSALIGEWVPLRTSQPNRAVVPCHQGLMAGGLEALLDRDLAKGRSFSFPYSIRSGLRFDPRSEVNNVITTLQLCARFQDPLKGESGTSPVIYARVLVLLRWFGDAGHQLAVVRKVNSWWNGRFLAPRAASTRTTSLHCSILDVSSGFKAHPSFDVHDILELLACELVESELKATAISLACCCRSFEDLVLRALWETQNWLTPLPRCLAQEVWEEDGYKCFMSSVLMFHLPSVLDHLF